MKYTLKDIPMMVYLGVPEWEREAQQKVTIDLIFSADAQQGVQTDDIEDVFDYFPLHKMITHFGGEKHFKLLERLGAELKQTIQKNFPEISDLTLTITKTPFPEGSISIEI